MNFFGLIGFDHYEIDCIIGNNPEEREVSQKIYIDLRIEQDFSLIATEDSLEKTLCYEMLGEVLKKLSLKKYRLLETFAYETIQTLMNQYQLKWAFVRIKKPAAIAEADYAVVELEGGKRG